MSVFQLTDAVLGCSSTQLHPNTRVEFSQLVTSILNPRLSFSDESGICILRIPPGNPLTFPAKQKWNPKGALQIVPSFQHEGLLIQVGLEKRAENTVLEALNPI